MFYEVSETDEESYEFFEYRARDLVIAMQCMIIEFFTLGIMMYCFEKSRPDEQQIREKIEVIDEDEIEGKDEDAKKTSKTDEKYGKEKSDDLDQDQNKLQKIRQNVVEKLTKLKEMVVPQKKEKEETDHELTANDEKKEGANKDMAGLEEKAKRKHFAVKINRAHSDEGISHKSNDRLENNERIMRNCEQRNLDVWKKTTGMENPLWVMNSTLEKDNILLQCKRLSDKYINSKEERRKMWYQQCAARISQRESGRSKSCGHKDTRIYQKELENNREREFNNEYLTYGHLTVGKEIGDRYDLKPCQETSSEQELEKEYSIAVNNLRRRYGRSKNEVKTKSEKPEPVIALAEKARSFLSKKVLNRAVIEPFFPTSIEGRETFLPKAKRAWLILAWTLLIVIILTCAYLIILLGLKFGRVKATKWLTSTVFGKHKEKRSTIRLKDRYVR